MRRIGRISSFLLFIGLPIISGFVTPLAVSQTSQLQHGRPSTQVWSSVSVDAVEIPLKKQQPTIAENPLQRFSTEYSRWTQEHYLVMAFVQAATLPSLADLSTQSMELASGTAGALNIGHVAAMATVASTMSGVMNAIWLRQLEDRFPGKETSMVITKTMIHAVIIASIINSAYLVGVPLLTDHVFCSDHSAWLSSLLLHSHNTFDWSILRGGWTWDEFVILTKLEVAMFIPYNTLAFKYVPPSIRPLTHAAISATFNVAVSAVTLGYFNTWCERAMQHMPFLS